VYIIYSENVHWSKGWDIPEINISLNFTKKAILNSLLQFQDQFVFQQKLDIKKAIKLLPKSVRYRNY
jgi:hypothetical protein